MTVQNILTLRLRLRPDLAIGATQHGSKNTWTVKDPVTMRYFTFSVEEFWILRSLDGNQQLEDLRTEFERRFPPQRMTTTHLVKFISELHSNGLLLSDDEGQGKALLEKRAKDTFQERLAMWSNPLAIRFRGIDPETFLNWLYPRMRWCFSVHVAIVVFILVAAAILLMATHFRDFRDELPTISDFVSAKNLLWLSLSLALVKILHELGHGLSCKHFGGECHEMGFMLLMLVPCMYCNVSDAWMLKKRYQRIAISLAGILVEVALGSVAIFAWWYTQPGFWHVLAANTVLVCGFGTIVLNGNPLLRYDGYFVLSDLLGIQNLWHESRLALRQQFYNFFVSGRLDSAATVGERSRILLIYAVSSKAYRLVIFCGIALALYGKFVAMRLEILAWLFNLTLAIAWILTWGPVVFQRLSDPTFLRRVRWVRAGGTAATLVAGLIVLTFVRFPCTVLTPVLFQLEGTHQVYVSTAGILKSCVIEGTQVDINQQVAMLENSEVERKIIELTGEREKLLARVSHLEARASIDATLAADLAVAREMCKDVEQRLEQQLREKKALILTAPIAGIVIAPPSSVTPGKDNSKLATWSGSPLEARNNHCNLQRGTLFCLIGDPTKFEAIAFVDETDIEFIRLNQRTILRAGTGDGHIIVGRVKEIAERDVQFIPVEMAWERDLATRREESRRSQPLETSYQVRIQLEGIANCPLINGSRGMAKVEVEPQTIAEQLFRKLRRTLSVKVWNSDANGR